MRKYAYMARVRDYETMIRNNNKKHIKLNNFRENKISDTRLTPEYYNITVCVSPVLILSLIHI